METTIPVECCICLSIMVEPIRLFCSHLICFSCLEQMILNSNFKCPMDRKVFNIENDLEFDQSIFERNLKLLPEDFMEKATKIGKMIEESSIMLPLQIKYGNYHRYISHADDANKHEWKCFVKLEKSSGAIHNALNNLIKNSPIYKVLREIKAPQHSEEKDLEINENEIIKKVVFRLHPTFNPPVVHRSHSPFEISRLGWGIFNINIEIEFHDSLEMEKIELDHMLSFSHRVKESVREIFVKKKDT